jgi:biotin transporter BioY
VIAAVLVALMVGYLLGFVTMAMLVSAAHRDEVRS